MFGINLPGLPNLPMPGLPLLPLPLPIPGLNLPLPGMPGGQGPQIQQDQVNVTAPAGGFGAGVSGNGFADIDNVNLDPAELRALDNMMQTYLADGKFTPAEQKVYQEVRALFARSGGPAPAPAPNPTGGAVPTTPTSPSTPVPPSTPAPKDLWSVGDKCANGRTFKSWGDPHEVSGDGLKFDNMKQGTFTKLKSASGDFEVQTTQDKDKSGRWPGATLNHKAAVKSGNDVVAYDGLSKSMTINGKNVPIPKNGESVPLPGGGKVTGTADGVQIETAKGDKVNIHQKDSYIDISGEVSANRKDGEIRGSLGAMDADNTAANDLLGRDGKQYNAGNKQSLDAFLEDWRVKPGEDLFNTNPAGGAGPTPAVNPDRAAAEAEFDKMDVTKNGYLSGTEITPELKGAFPGQDRITKDQFVNWKMGQLEAQRAAADEAEFTKRDVNKDGQLDGNEIGDAAKYDKGGNWTRPDGTSQTEISKEEFMAGRKADRAGAPAATNPAGGAGPVGMVDTNTENKPDAPQVAGPAPAAPVKKKKRKRGFFSKLKRSLKKMAGTAFKIVKGAALMPFRIAKATTEAGLNVAGAALTGNPQNVMKAAVGGAFNVAAAHDPFAGIKL